MFVITGCYHCLIYKEFIDRFNLKMPLNKRIQIINCDSYYDFGVPEHPLIEVFAEYLEGTFPTLFFEGLIVRGANTREELEAFLRGLTHQDFVNKEPNSNIFNKTCKYIKEGFFKNKLECY